jgi:elongation factor 2
MGEIHSLVGAAFKWATSMGALCEEPLRGVRFNLVDAVLTSDSMHRGPGQIFPTTRRVLAAAQLTAQPRLLEPLYLVETHARRSDVDAVTAVIVQRRGQVLSSDPVYVEKDNEDAGLCKIRAYLPVIESFGFAFALAREASGAFPHVSFCTPPTA